MSDGAAYAASSPFPLWKSPEQLADRLSACIDDAPRCEGVALTMTGELADCFRSKSEGVCHILRAAEKAAGDRRVRVYQTNGLFVACGVAASHCHLTAASNWHALASFAARYAGDRPAVLVDVGSTTCDFVPLVDGAPAPKGRDDTSRLLGGELLYTGIERTPVCAVADCVPYRRASCPVAAELFATMRDVYVTLGDLPEQPECHETADGRPATRAASAARLGRMICADHTQFREADAVEVARAVADRQARRATESLRRVVRAMSALPQTLVLSGHGEFLARRALASAGLSAELVSLTEVLGPAAARAAAAHAVAVLAGEACTE
jgi:probable H4MPT-linked C1 transfer pathway protein